MISTESRLLTLDYYPGLFIRRAMIANALSVRGFHGGTPDTYDAFQRLLGPSTDGKYNIWPLRKRYDGTPSGGISTCGMVALGLLRRLGVACTDIMNGYHDDIGSGLDVAKYWAKSLYPTAWGYPSHGSLPEPGDIVQLLCPMHVLTVIGWEVAADGTPMCISIDGGQIHLDGLQTITRCIRPWANTSVGARLGGRQVDGWIDVDKIPIKGPVIVPEGWADVKVPVTWEAFADVAR